MSRSGYSTDYEYMALYRNTVERSMAGKRGQKFLSELRDALDAMTSKRLIAEELITENGECCAIGSFCKAKGISVEEIDYEDPDQVGKLVGISASMAAEIEYENDEHDHYEIPEQRWKRMREWVDSKIKVSK